MANGWNNTVPLGQAGTGAAYILPQSSAAANYGQNVRHLDQQRMMQDRLRRQEAQQLAKSYRDNMLTASDGRLWANEIGKLEQDHIRQGMDYRAQGWDIYNPDPNNQQQMQAHTQYMQDRARLEALRGYRSGIEDQYNKTQESLRKANLGEYNPADIQRLHDFVTGNSVMDLYEQNAQLPEVGRRFDPSQYLPKTAATTDNTTVANNIRTNTVAIDEPTTRASVLGSIANAPGGAEFLNDITGGINPNYLLQAPDSLQGIRELVVRDYQGDPELRRTLASSPQPVIPDTPAFERWADDQADRIYQAKQRFQPQFESWVDQVVGGTKTGITETLDFAAENQARAARNEVRADIRLALSQQRERRLAAGETPDGASVPDPIDVSIPYGPIDESGVRPRTPVRNYLPISIPSKNFMGADAIDLNTGRKTTLGESSTNYSVVGLTEVPVGKGRNVGESLVQENYARENPDRVQYKPMIHVTMGDGEDYFLDLDRMPQGLTKEQKAIIARFRQTIGRTTTQTNSSDPLGLGI